MCRRKTPHFETIPAEPPLFSFGIFTDVQYANKSSTPFRHYRDSDKKLEAIITAFNQENLQFIINLGDLIDEKFINYAPVMDILHQSRHKIYHVLGNHDFNVEDTKKGEILDLFGLKSAYYSFKESNWKFIILDGNDISVYKYPAASSETQFARQYKHQNKINSPDYNGAIGSSQITWLKRELQQAENDGQNVLVFNHFPIFPKIRPMLWNYKEMMKTIEPFQCIKGYIAGHEHPGRFGLDRKIKIPFITLQGVVNPNANVYYICRMYPHRFILEGYGRENFRKYKATACFTFQKKKIMD